jgi:hypothetical protein
MKKHSVSAIGKRTKIFWSKARAWRYAQKLIEQGFKPMLWTFL